MSSHDALALLPVLLLIAAALLGLLAVAIHRHHGVVCGLTALAFAAALLTLLLAPDTPRQVTTLLHVDAIARLYMGLISVAGLLITLLSFTYWQRRSRRPEEYYLLLLISAAGGMILAASTHFATLFLGFEIMSVGIYVMAAYQRRSRQGLEAGLKYLVLSGLASPFILFGMALIYTGTGVMTFDGIFTHAMTRGVDVLFLTGAALIFVGVGFKLALFPFYQWAADVYEGAPAVVTAFITTVSKGAVVALLLRFFLPLRELGGHVTGFVPLVTILAIATMFAGNLLALRQPNLKRLLAYSSIAHMGYLLVPFAAGGSLAAGTITFYLATYIITVLGAFGVITVVSGQEHDVDGMADYREMAWRHPWVAGVLTACLMSLAGLPLTAGFVGKFSLVMAGIGAGQWLLILALAANSAISLYYYLRVVRELYRHPQVGSDAPLTVRVSLLGGIALTGITLLMAWIGIYPTPLLALLQRLMP